jgi:hypothetical protein
MIQAGPCYEEVRECTDEDYKSAIGTEEEECFTGMKFARGAN